MHQSTPGQSYTIPRELFRKIYDQRTDDWYDAYVTDAEGNRLPNGSPLPAGGYIVVLEEYLTIIHVDDSYVPTMVVEGD